MAERAPAAARQVQQIFIILEEYSMYGMAGSGPVRGRIRPKTAGAAEVCTPLSQNPRRSNIGCSTSCSHANLYELRVRRVINTEELRSDRG